jgi:hypothetical protein
MKYSTGCFVFLSLFTLGYASADGKISDKFIGHWEPAQKWCKISKTNETKEGIDIRVTKVVWYETTCELNTVSKSKDNTFSGMFTCESEGESRQQSIDLKISSDGKLILQADKMKLTGIRCEP